MGFTTFMQDWLNAQFEQMDATTQSVDVGRMWLMQMGEGARVNGITIQYCMSLSRHVLQSLEVPVVTQVGNLRATKNNYTNQGRIRGGVGGLPPPPLDYPADSEICRKGVADRL